MAKIIGIAALVLILGLSTIFGLNYFRYGTVAFFAPKYEGVRRDVMIESRVYSEATVRELYRLKRQYQTSTTADARATIRAIALHEFSIFPTERLPADLQVWLAQLD